jgi:hypothetical protein
VANGVIAKFLGNGNSGGLAPSQIMRGAGQSFVSPENNDGLSRTGYTFAGWNTLASGRGTTYVPGSAIEMRSADVSLYAMWTQNPIKAATASMPTISGFATATSNGKNVLTAYSGPWSGFPKPVLTYQWYSCTGQITATLATVPGSCTKIANATSSKLSLTMPFKGRYIVVSVTGQSAGTSPTVSYSQSTGMIR